MVPYPWCNLNNTIAEGAFVKPWESLCKLEKAGTLCNQDASTSVMITMDDDGIVSLVDDLAFACGFPLPIMGGGGGGGYWFIKYSFFI